MGTKFTEAEHRIVTALLETKAVDFETIGKAIAEHGASATLNLDGDDAFCGTMRNFIRLYRLADNISSLEALTGLKEISAGIQSR